MRLTAIKLAGFKSFVDATTLTLDADLTGIVGPNGCGKSNVIDAVRWVTGESSAKQLRGAALEDVIFNGSKARKPVGRAAIELRFDNADGQLGGQYARFAEISVRREMSREGGSRYFINSSRARRRDVVDLFLGTGLGGRSNYAIIEQGAVNRLIEAKPDDMRQILEEAAGISRYKERRRETENRLRHTRDNLERLDDLIGEVTQRLTVLQRQARDAEQYKRLKQDERRMRAELLALRWRDFDADVQTAQAELDRCEQALATAVSSQREARQERGAHDRARQAAADACQQYQAAYYDAQGEATRIAQALEHVRRMQAMQQRERDELQARRAQLENRAGEDQTALEQVERELAAAAEELAQQRQVRDAARKRVAQAEAAIEQAEQQRDAHDSGRTPVAELEAERTQRDYLVRRMEQTVATRDKRQQEAATLVPDAQADELQTLDAQIAAQEQQIAADESRAQAAAEQAETLRTELDTLTRQVDALRTRLAEQQARLASEKALQQGVLREDDTQVTQWLADQGHGDAQGVARSIEAPAQWQTAIEAALHEWLAGFAVDALPVAVADWPDSTLTLIEAGTPQTDADAPALAGLPSLASRIRAPAAVLTAARRVFVAEDIATALATRSQLRVDQRIVSLDGACVGPQLVRTPATDEAGRGVLQRQHNIKQLDAECEANAARLDELSAQRAAVDEQRQAAAASRRELEETLATARRELARRQAQQHGLQTRLEQRRQRAAEVAEELTRLEQQQQQDNVELADLDQRIADLTDKAADWRQERDAAQAGLEQARDGRRQERQALDEAEATVRRVEQAQTAGGGRRDSLVARLEDTRTTQAQVSERLAALDSKTDDSVPEDAPQQADHEAARQRQKQAERELRTARATLQDAEQRGEEAARTAMNADAAVEQAREAMQQARIRVETAGARRDGLVEQLDEVDADAATLLADLDDRVTVADWQERIERLERRIARLGAINLAAIEEYDAEAERQQYLDRQREDLTAALATLEDAISKIDRETRTRFSNTFARVNERFGALFPTLFGGGHAELELTEDDLLATGVRVMARPPGKRNASIQMLSGGEKALTAVALIFALFELNPAPFCMLDEIDAPLDDANVARFCELVRQMSERVQFIVITHNKLTMELVEQLHGVTMAEPGVSRLVSVNIDQALDMAG